MLKKNFPKSIAFLAVIAIVILPYFSYLTNTADGQKRSFRNSRMEKMVSDNDLPDQEHNNEQDRMTGNEKFSNMEPGKVENTDMEPDKMENADQFQMQDINGQDELDSADDSFLAPKTLTLDRGKIMNKDSYSLDVLLPQNGVTISQSFQTKVQSRSKFLSMALYKLKITDEGVSDENGAKKTIDLQYIDGDWIGAVDITNMKDGTYHFQVKGRGADQKDYRSFVFWLNIDKSAPPAAKDIMEDKQYEETKFEERQLNKSKLNNKRENKQGGQKITDQQKEENQAEDMKRKEEWLDENKQEEQKTTNQQTEENQAEDMRRKENQTEQMKREEERLNEDKPKEERTVEQRDHENQTGKKKTKEESPEPDDVYFQISGLCIEAGLKDKQECLKLFQEPNICKNLDKQKCQVLLRDVILADFIPQTEMEEAGQEAENIVGYNLNIKVKSEPGSKRTESAKDFDIKLEKDGEVSLADENTKKFVEKFIPINLQQQKQVNLMVLAAQNKSNKIIPAVIALDDDSDGIPNDSEERIGTDPNSADTDGDGYDDYEEILNGYNPLGAGKITPDISQKLAAVDLAIINHRSLEQPKEQGQQTDILSVEKIGNAKVQGSKSTILLRGKARANSVITLYIYSQLPLVLTTRTDANGNWIYELDEKLTDGTHQVYVAVNDNTGKIRYKSSPFTFFIREAKAVTRVDYLNAATNASNSQSTNNFGYYILATLLVVVLLILIYLFFVHKKNRGLNIMEE